LQVIRCDPCLVSLYAQEQLAVALEEGRRLGREAEQAAGRQAILTRTVDDLARRLQDALCRPGPRRHNNTEITTHNNNTHGNLKRICNKADGLNISNRINILNPK